MGARAEVQIALQKYYLINPDLFMISVMSYIPNFDGNPFEKAFDAACVATGGMNDSQITTLLETMNVYVECSDLKDEQRRNARLVRDAVGAIAYLRDLLPEEPIRGEWSDYEPGK